MLRRQTRQTTGRCSGQERQARNVRSQIHTLDEPDSRTEDGICHPRTMRWTPVRCTVAPRQSGAAEGMLHRT
eukprot:8103208-Pyramimonas_sp.AAC.1